MNQYELRWQGIKGETDWIEVALYRFEEDADGNVREYAIDRSGEICLSEGVMAPETAKFRTPVKGLLYGARELNLSIMREQYDCWFNRQDFALSDASYRLYAAFSLIARSLARPWVRLIKLYNRYIRRWKLKGITHHAHRRTAPQNVTAQLLELSRQGAPLSVLAPLTQLYAQGLFLRR